MSELRETESVRVPDLSVLHHLDEQAHFRALAVPGYSDAGRGGFDSFPLFSDA